MWLITDGMLLFKILTLNYLLLLLHTFVRSALLRLATLRAFLRVLLMNAGLLSPAMAFWRRSVLARISSGLRPLAASSLCIAARI